jgi:methylenetetrahydrofolate reductase (NADPH)
MDVLKTDLLQRYGIRTAFFAGHPEGHPSVAAPVMHAALQEKLRWAEANGIEAGVATQFCFEATPILSWLGDLRAGGFCGEVRVGLAGPARPTALLKFALRCGVGASVRALRQRPQRFGRLMAETGPDAVLQGLQEGRIQDRLGPVGLHIFPFGGLASTAAWIRSLTTGNRREGSSPVQAQR